MRLEHRKSNSEISSASFQVCNKSSRTWLCRYKRQPLSKNMVKTRRQAPDKIVEGVRAVGTGSSAQPEPNTGTSSSDQVQRSTKQTRRKGNVASIVAEEAQKTMASLSQQRTQANKIIKWTFEMNEFIMCAYYKGMELETELTTYR